MKRKEIETIEKDPPEQEKHKTDAVWEELLNNTTVKDVSLKKKRDLIIIDESATLKQTLHILNKENILSVPVVDKNGMFIGFVDVLDIASCVYREWKRLSGDLSSTLFPDNLFFDTLIKDILNLQSKSTVFVNSSDSLSSLIHTFRSPRTANRLHRVAVLESNKMVDVISQTDIVNFVAENLDKFPKSKADKTVEELKLIHSPIMITIDSSIADALLTLCNNKISGLALVDGEFKLTGNFSASDLRGIDPTCFEFFSGSVLQFLAKQSSSTKPTKYLKEGSTFSEVIKEVVNDRIHRIFITTENGFPKGVISLIDIICAL